MDVAKAIAKPNKSIFDIISVSKSLYDWASMTYPGFMWSKNRATHIGNIDAGQSLITSPSPVLSSPLPKRFPVSSIFNSSFCLGLAS